MNSVSTKLPISPPLNPEFDIFSPRDVRNALFQLSAMDDFSQVFDILKRIYTVLDRDPRVNEHLPLLRNLNYFPKNNDPRRIAEALCEIANSPGAVQTLHQNSETRTLLEKTIEHFKIDVTQIQAQAESWRLSTAHRCADVPWIHTTRSLGDEARYWTSAGAVMSAFGLGIVGGIPSFAYEIVNLLQQSTLHGTLPIGVLATCALLAGLARVAYKPWAQGTQRIIEKALQNTLTPQNLESFLRDPLSSLDQTDSGDLIDYLRANAGSGTQPFRSRVAILRMGADLINMGSVATTYLQSYPPDHHYDRMITMIALAMLNRAQCHFIPLNPDKLLHLQKPPEEGTDEYVYSNHRSQDDIVIDAALACSARIVAKKELLVAPVLGWTPLHGIHIFQEALLRKTGHVLINREGGQKARSQMITEASAALDTGHRLLWYPEGTRFHEKNRQGEVGIQPFKDGVFFVPATRQKKARITPLLFWGLGNMLPKSVLQDFREGLMVHQPIAIYVGESLEVERTSGMDPKTLAKELRLESFWRSWRALSRLQATMNNSTHRNLARI